MTSEGISLKRRLASHLISLTRADYWLRLRNSKILMYHRVIKIEDSPIPLEPGMHVAPSTFEMQAETLSKKFKVIPLEEYLEESLKQEKMPHDALALTFDDGWLDFYNNAAPILEAYNLPSTTFLPTKFIGSSRLFWSDSIAAHIQVFQKEGIKEEKINSKLSGKLGNETLRLLTSSITSPENTSIILSQLINHLKSLPIEERKQSLQLIEDLRKEHCVGTPPVQFMNWDQVSELSSKALFSFGSHGHGHFRAVEITNELLKEDVIRSVSEFKAHNIPMCNVFCYPNQDRSLETDTIIQEAHFLYSLGRHFSDEEETKKLALPCFERINIHQDVSSTEELFTLRIWGQ